MASKAFLRLATKITREYRRKGYPAARAREIGQATAGKVANEKHQKASA